MSFERLERRYSIPPSYPETMKSLWDQIDPLGEEHCNRHPGVPVGY